MKKILVPIDFSENALSAIEYAFNIGALCNAEIIILHVYHALIPTSYAQNEYTAVVKAKQFQKEEEMKTYEKKVLQHINPEYGLVNYSTRLSFGFAVDEIIEVATEEKVDMIIMGTQGASGMKKVLLGTISYEVIKKAKCPVMAVPAHVAFCIPETIVLATAFHEIKDMSVYKTLLEIALLFNAEVKIARVDALGELTPTMAHVNEKLKTEKAFKNVPHSYDVIRGVDTVRELEDFALSSRADILAVLPQEHNFFSRIFEPNVTKTLAHRSQLPLLALKTL